MPRHTAPASRTASTLRPDADVAVRVLRQFRQIFNAVKTHFQQVEKTAGLGGAQVWALSVIAQAPQIGVGALARTMHIHQSTASNLVRGLVERDLVSVTRPEDDRRSVRLRLRPIGARLLRRSPGPFAGILPQALAALETTTLRRLDTDLGKLIAALDGDASDGVAGRPTARARRPASPPLQTRAAREPRARRRTSSDRARRGDSASALR